MRSKICRNLYLAFKPLPNYFNKNANLILQYTDNIYYNVMYKPSDFDYSKDLYYRCTCDMDFFKKIEKLNK